MKKRYSAEEKAMWVEDWRGSGKSAWVYAKENGINPQTFVNWTNPEKGEARFVEVRAPITPSVQGAVEILIEKGEVKVHLPLGINRSELRAVIEGLGWAV